jgi:outer membrane protein
MRFQLAAFIVAFLPLPLAAQAGAGPTLSLEEAISIARQNNPAYREALNMRSRTSAQVRSASGALLPDVDASFSTGYREGRPQYFGGLAFGSSSSTLSSSLNLSMGAAYNAATLMLPKQARANAEATEADIVAAEQALRTGVTQQYIAALSAGAAEVLQDTLVASAEQQLELARARAAAGAATQLDVQRAEVQLGQAQVARIRAQNSAAVEKLRLFQQIGVAQPASVRLTTEFAVQAPSFSLEQVLEQARQANPALLAARARSEAADVGVSRARSEYTPTLSLRAGVGGFTNKVTDESIFASNALRNAQGECLSTEQFKALAGQPSNPAACSSITLSPSQQASVDRQLESNRSWPFGFTRDPYTLNATVSFPIFNGFQREQRVAEARAARNDAEYVIRAYELRLTADVTSAYLTLMANYRAIAIEAQNAATARQALTLAEERYRVGANTFLDVTQSRTEYVRAQNDYLNAVYEYHRAFAALESAIGRPLR